MLRILWRFGNLLLVVVGCCGVVVAYDMVVGMFAGGTAAVPKSAQSWYCCCCWSWCVVWWQVVCGDHWTWLQMVLVVLVAHVEIFVRVVSISSQRNPPACVSTVVW